MPLRRRGFAEAAVLAFGLAVAAVWPLSAYAFSPLLLPAAALGAGMVVLILRRPEYGIAVGAALFPLLNITLNLGRLGTFQPLKFTLPVLPFVLLAYGLVTVRRKEGWEARGLAVVVLVMALVAAASDLSGVASSAGVGDLAQLVAAAGLGLAVLQICRRPSQLVVVVAGVLVGLLIASTQGIYQHFAHQYSTGGFLVDGENVGRIAGSFPHPNQFAGYVAVFIPLAGALAFTKGVPRWLRIGSAIIFALALPALSYAYARGAIGALVLGCVIWLALQRRGTALVALVVVAIAGFLVAPTTLKDRLQSVDSGEVTLRSDLWKSALDIYSRDPVLGAGLGRFADAYEALPSTGNIASQKRLLHNQQVLVPPAANNLYLTTLAEQGFLGLLALLAFLAYALWAAFAAAKSAHPIGRAIGFGLGAGTLTLMLHGILEVTLMGVLAPLIVLTAAAVLYPSLEK
ncbi:MAG: O-antigen ligase family protein, partial [Solirubrobacterales bacterium]